MSSEDVKVLAETVKQQQQQLISLMDTIKSMPGVSRPVEVRVAPPPPDAAEAKAEKVRNLAICMRKSSRIKPFKFDHDVLVFLKKFKEELASLKSISGITFDLTEEEYIPIFKASLDFAVLERLE